MYFPYLRGRQFELIAIRESLKEGILSPKVVPIIEPVRASSTLLKTLSEFNSHKHNIAFIVNPIVGSFISEFRSVNGKEELLNQLKLNNVIKSCIVDNRFGDFQKGICEKFKQSIEESLYILNKHGHIDIYLQNMVDKVPKYILIPDEREYKRQIKRNRVLLSDSFDAKDRNADYQDTPEFFSSDNQYFQDDGYIGFSDYSIVGDKYQEAGFAPHCVVIHIVYKDDKDNLMIKHFSSDSNEDSSDPANKFREALEKLLSWDEQMKLNTYAMREFHRLYQNGLYPGLGTIKKLSIMNHLEIVSKYLER